MKTPLGLYSAKDTVIHKLSSLPKLLCFMLLFTASILASNIIGYLSILLVCLLIMKISELEIKQLISQSKNLWSFFLLIFLMNATLSQRGDAFFTFSIFSISRESLLYGFNTIFHILLAIFLTSVYTATSSPMEITEALRRFLSPLALLHIPTDDAAAIISIALQFIPSLSEETNMLIKAQKARGADIQKGSLISRGKDALPLIIPIFISAFRRADEVAMAMEARGYRGEKNRRRKKGRKFSSSDYLAILISITVLAFEVFIRRIS